MSDPGPLLNGDLFNAEEKDAEMGLGYVMAARRLNLIYLADITAMDKLLKEHANQALTLFIRSKEDPILKARLYEEISNITERLAKILRGGDSGYMAIPWFTDPNQLRQTIYNEMHAVFGDDPQLSGWKADPIREQACCFLEGAVQIAEDATSQAEYNKDITMHVRNNLALFLGIPADQLKRSEQEAATAIPENEA